MGILNSYQHFAAPALTPSMYNIGIILGTLLLYNSMGVRGAAWGTVLGAALHMAIQIPFVLRLPHFSFKPAISLKTAGVTDVLKLMGPRLLGLGVVQINFWVNIILASAMSVGSISALQTAYTLMFTVLGILGQSLGTAVFPTLSTQYAQNDTEGFQRTFSGAIRNVLFLSIPAGLGMAILSKPIVTVLFERGEWTTADTSATAWALVFYSIGLMGHTALEILARTFYALHNTWTPVIIGGMAMLLNIILSVIFVVIFEALGADTFARGPYAGLALANSLATALESTILWILLRRRIPTLNAKPILNTLSRTLVAGIGMVVIAGAWLLISEDFHQLIRLLIGLILGISSFWGIAIAVHIDEAQSVPRQILSRFSKS
jgi:putative peptidoglycan lipid II flippase